ncbi:protein YgfX [Psychromonas antarctica]|uniref:protein YgfX n=1 Tax=Psychromonas antarctica TaxID=67573 RepID=UPI001EE99720|nr:protein YgfX [Psychromonas antarctica]MCG6201487.1 hypothetical protein [Psychromonas antarctica]
MLSSNALKYNIAVHPSFYAGGVVFLLYFYLLLLSLLILGLSGLMFSFFVFLSAVALYGGKKAYGQEYDLRLSDSGLVEIVCEDNDVTIAEISRSSFYNHFCLCLHLQKVHTDISNLIDKKKKVEKFFVVIYRDAVSEAEYRLLARLINTGRY